MPIYEYRCPSECQLCGRQTFELIRLIDQRDMPAVCPNGVTSEARCVTAPIYLSDGLSASLPPLNTAEGVDARVDDIRSTLNHMNAEDLAERRFIAHYL